MKRQLTRDRIVVPPTFYRYSPQNSSTVVLFTLFWIFSVFLRVHQADSFSHNSVAGLADRWKNCSPRINVYTKLNRKLARYEPRIYQKTLHTSQEKYWEGDDIRWISKIRRLLRRTFDWKGQPMRNTIIAMNMALFVYQSMNTIDWIRQQYPQVWPSQVLPIAFDTLMGNSRPGPFTVDFVHSKLLSHRQPHRYLTAGFLHGSIIHLLLNLNALRQLPPWLETGLGARLYGTIFVFAICGGNVLYSLTTTEPLAFCLGSSGGICGLYGLMYVCLVRMGNQKASWRVLQGMGFLFLWGFFMSHISNAGHLGGFITGIAVTLLTGPTYRSSYALRRKNSLEVDLYSRDYRLAMGYDKVPSKSGWIPLPFLWSIMALACLSQDKFRSIPRLIVQGILHPGALSGIVR